MTHLHVREHSMKDAIIFEVWDGHQLVACIYALTDERGIRVISKYQMTIEPDYTGFDAEVQITFAERASR